MLRTHDTILSRVQKYYDHKIQLHGATALGVDWNSPASQQLRFQQLLKIVDRTSSFSINDFGCGYGALVDYLRDQQYLFRYCGFDTSPRMISKAAELHEKAGEISFVALESELSAADYTIASGIFNVRLETPLPEWEAYVLDTLATFETLSTKGFAFNILSRYADKELMRPDLYYADPAFLFDYCKTHFSRSVALLH